MEEVEVVICVLPLNLHKIGASVLVSAIGGTIT
ncbi:hypothetical protein T09_15840 [Trichinella sp. T9]|nr:hypothetical protein T09_15840 [Trichinella sp. T9]